MGVVFAQKVHEFTTRLDYSIFGQNGVKFLSETLLLRSILPLYVGFLGDRLAFIDFD